MGYYELKEPFSYSHYRSQRVWLERKAKELTKLTGRKITPSDIVTDMIAEKMAAETIAKAKEVEPA